MKKKKLPHEIDAEFDILNTAGLEPDHAIELRRLPNGTRVIKPLTWKDYPALIQKLDERLPSQA